MSKTMLFICLSLESLLKLEKSVGFLSILWLRKRFYSRWNLFRMIRWGTAIKTFILYHLLLHQLYNFKCWKMNAALAALTQNPNLVEIPQTLLQFHKKVVLKILKFWALYSNNLRTKSLNFNSSTKAII